MSHYESIETLSLEKQKLLELEKTNKYVFHGSEVEIEEFEPRQAHNFIKGEKIPDGDPAVFASSKAEYAIFMAIINKANCANECRSGVSASSNDGETFVMRYRATDKTLSQLKDEASGFVYVFDRSMFTQRKEGGIEFVSTERVSPIEKIKVNKIDLPQDIEVLGE